MEAVGNSSSHLITSVRIYGERDTGMSQKKNLQIEAQVQEQSDQDLREMKMLTIALKQIERLENSGLLNSVA